MRLNPYSTGSNSNFTKSVKQSGASFGLNPYSTGSNSNIFWNCSGSDFEGDVLILILLEVTQIDTWYGKKDGNVRVLILILLEVTQIHRRVMVRNNGSVLILILLEVTQIFIVNKGELHTCLNPYSTGSNSNYGESSGNRHQSCLNPYSTGSNSNSATTELSLKSTKRLNPYSTGSNSNALYSDRNHRLGFLS